MTKQLLHPRVVSSVQSEEVDEITYMSPSSDVHYSVAFAPLDGSSLVDVNLAVGTIISIFAGNTPMNVGREQVAAMYILYGPRTTLVVVQEKVCMNLE